MLLVGLEGLWGTVMLADGTTHRLRAPIDEPTVRAEARRPELPLCACHAAGGHEPVRSSGVTAPPPRRYRLQLAIETDWEYRQLFDDMDAVDIAIPDAPHADEIVIALALSCGGRPGARVRKP